MPQKRKKLLLIGICAGVLVLSWILSAANSILIKNTRQTNHNTYFPLPADDSKEDPLAYINEDFSVSEGFHTNLPIVILSIEDEIPDYKYFLREEENLTGEIPWTDGYMEIIDNGNFSNSLMDTPSAESRLRIKKRGHTSYTFDKEQYSLKLVQDDGTKNPVDVMGMGAEDEWILNGSMADKSMIRNYLSYRIASECMDTAVDSQYCEVLIKTEDKYVYQGLYLMMESISRGTDRIQIDESKKKNTYTSYIIRRDRFTHFDTMLDTYGRREGLSREWIGVKYPSSDKLTEDKIKYIEEDFSKTERVLYSEDDNVFERYDKYIDIDSFADYFLVNEFFGNYDSGEHSTYMYKNSGETLQIGPVWDFDQAMNNYFQEEMDPDTLAMQEKPFFKQLVTDRRFVKLLEKRYAYLRTNALSEEHINETIDEITRYIRLAKVREWNRWAADYEDNSGRNPGNYYLQDYETDGVTISRFNDNYDQEIYNIKNYLHKHGRKIAPELSKLEVMTVRDTGLKGQNELFLAIILVFFFIPSIYLIRKG